jgi:hypothetical protein
VKPVAIAKAVDQAAHGSLQDGSSGEGGVFTGGKIGASAERQARGERKSRGTNQDRWVFHARPN